MWDLWCTEWHWERIFSEYFKFRPGCSVGIATSYGLEGPGNESQWGTRFSAPVQTDPGAHPASCTMGTGSFPGVKSGLGVTLTPHLLLVPWSWKSRAIPLLPLWAVWPVQSLSACTRGHFTFLVQVSPAVIISQVFHTHLQLHILLPGGYLGAARERGWRSFPSEISEQWIRK